MLVSATLGAVMSRDAARSTSRTLHSPSSPTAIKRIAPAAARSLTFNSIASWAPLSPDASTRLVEEAVRWVASSMDAVALADTAAQYMGAAKAIDFAGAAATASKIWRSILLAGEVTATGRVYVGAH
jgi:hypothetical protein